MNLKIIKLNKLFVTKLILKGHNGAGKTTAIFMLTGLYSSTEGDAVVYGNSINQNIDLV